MLALGLEEQATTAAHVLDRLVAEARWQTKSCTAQSLQVGGAGFFF